MIPFDTAKKKFTQALKRKGRAKATLLAYAKDIEQLLDFISKEKKNLVHEIEKGDIDNFLNTLNKNGYTKKSISRKINSIKTFFKFLEGEGVLESNPAKLINHPKLTAKNPRIFSKIEFKALRDTVKNDIRTAAIFEVFLQTGIRISELANIKLEDIDMGEEGKKGILKIKSDKPHVARSIPLNSSCKEALKRYLKIRPKVKSNSLFITKTGKPLLVRNIRATLDRYFKKAGIENAKVNDIRHTFIAHHLKEGASLLYISKIAGHKRISTTERYLEYIEKEERPEKMELGEL